MRFEREHGTLADLLVAETKTEPLFTAAAAAAAATTAPEVSRSSKVRCLQCARALQAKQSSQHGGDLSCSAAREVVCVFTAPRDSKLGLCPAQHMLACAHQLNCHFARCGGSNPAVQQGAGPAAGQAQTLDHRIPVLELEDLSSRALLSPPQQVEDCVQAAAAAAPQIGKE